MSGKASVPMVGLLLSTILLTGAIKEFPDREIKVTAPKENEILQAGGVFEIQWLADPDFGSSMTIEFSRDGGRTWETLVRDVPNIGKYLWNVPRIESKACRIRVFYQEKPRFRGTSGKFVVR